MALEVAPDRWLFALLRGPGGFIGAPGRNLASALVNDTGDDVSTPEAMDRIDALALEEAMPLPSDAWPLLVTFDDVADPVSVRRLDPADLAATFGADVSLAGVSVALTEEAVTVGRVAAILRWFCAYHRPYRRLSGKSGPIADNDLSNNLGIGVFAIGACQ